MSLADLRNMDERLLFAKVLQAEAGSEGEEGLRGVANVVRNRVYSNGYGGDSFRDVLLAPGQFSPVNRYTGYAKGEQGVDLVSLQPSAEAMRIANEAYEGQIEDNTGGALNFVNLDISQPSWARNMSNVSQIGRHTFGTAGNAEGSTGAPTGWRSNSYAAPSEDVQLSYGDQYHPYGRTQVPRGMTPEEARARAEQLEAEEEPNFGADALASVARSSRNMTLSTQGRAPQAAPQQARGGPVNLPRVNTLGSPQGGDNLPRNDTLGRVPLQGAVPTGQPSLPLAGALPDNMPAPFNPETTRAFAGMDIQRFSDKDVDLAFGPLASTAEGGAFALASETVGGPLKYNLTPEDAPRNVREATAAVSSRNEPEQRDEFDVEGYKKKQRRRRFAADALEVLSVGLGQISSGRGLDLAPTLASQAERQQAAANSGFGAYGDLLIPGNEAALHKFLAENGQEHLIQIAKMGGTKYKEVALQEAVDYITATPAREQAAALQKRVVNYVAQTRGPQAAQMLLDDPGAMAAAQETYYKEMFGDGASVGGYRPEMSAKLAKKFRNMGLPDIADVVEQGGEQAYNEYLPKLGEILNDEEEATTLNNMKPEERTAYAIRNGVDQVTASNLADDPAAIGTVVKEAREDRKAVERLQPIRRSLMETAVPLLEGKRATDPLVLAYNNVASQDVPTQDAIAQLQEALEDADADLSSVPLPSNITQMASKLGLSMNDPLVQEALRQQPRAVERIQNDYAAMMSEQRGETATGPIPPAARLQEMAQQAGVDEATTRAALSGDQQAARSIMGSFAAYEEERAKQYGETQGGSRAETQTAEQYANTLLESGVISDDELSIAQTAGPEAAIEAAATRRATAVEQQAQRQEAARVGSTARVIGDRLTELTGDASYAEMLAGVETQDDLNAVISNIKDTGLPSEVMTALQASNSDTIMSALQSIGRAESGAPNLMEESTLRELESFDEGLAETEANLRQRRDLTSQMETLRNIVSAPGFNIEETGPLAPVLNQVRGLVQQTLGEGAAEAIQSGDVSTMVRLATAMQGQFFGDFRAEGSGQLTEKEGEFFRAAMAGPGDPGMKMALMAQRIIKLHEQGQVVEQARRDWREQALNSENPGERLRKREGLNEFITQRLDESGVTTLPSVDATSESFFSDLDRLNEQGQLEPSTVIRVNKESGPEFVMVRDILGGN